MKIFHNPTVSIESRFARFPRRALLAVALFGFAQSCTGGIKRSDSMDKFLFAESAAKEAVGNVQTSAWGENEAPKEFILRNWAKRQELPCLFSLSTEDSMTEYFPSPLAVRGVVARADKFALFFSGPNPTLGGKSAGNYWVNEMEWWRVNHASGKEYFSFQFIKSNAGSFMLNALPFGDTNGMAPYTQLINLVEEYQAELSETPESFLFIATIPNSEDAAVSSDITSVSTWGPASVEIFVHKQSLQPTAIRVKGTNGEIHCKIDYLETLIQFDDTTLEYSAPENSIILYDERE